MERRGQPLSFDAEIRGLSGIKNRMVLNHFAYGQNYVDHVFGMAFVLRGCPVCCFSGPKYK